MVPQAGLPTADPFLVDDTGPGEVFSLVRTMVPPLTVSADRLVVSAMLEPRYHTGGDGFDHALDGPLAHLMIFDAAGHGLRAGLAFAVATAAVRAARRAGLDLHGQARAADAALLDQFSDARFVTAIMAQLNLDTGLLRYINAAWPGRQPEAHR